MPHNRENNRTTNGVEQNGRRPQAFFCYIPPESKLSNSSRAATRLRMPIALRSASLVSVTRACQIGDFNPLSDSSARLSHAGLSEAEQSHIALGFGQGKVHEFCKVDRKLLSSSKRHPSNKTGAWRDDKDASFADDSAARRLQHRPLVRAHHHRAQCPRDHV